MPRSIKDKQKARMRASRKKAGLCVLCGKQPPRVGEVGCDYCYSRNAEYKLEMGKDSRDMGFCVQCRAIVSERNEKTGRLFARCPHCRAYQNKRRSGYYQDFLEQRVEAHQCLDCGEEVTRTNPQTGNYYRRCLTCRLLKTRREHEQREALVSG